MRDLYLLIFYAALGVLSGWGAEQNESATPAARTFVLGDKDFLLDGRRFQIRCGEMHFERIPREYWRHRLQMLHAMGLNTVCVYLFWNKIEWTPGNFDWSGQNDAAEFCHLAQQEGLWVLLRPGPYSCAEWDEGGLPWWLLKNPDVQLRTRDPAFLGPALAYLKEVGRVLGPLQVTHGGPILMAQVENEYGSFGRDSEYIGLLRKAMLDAGFDVPLFCCNPPNSIPNGLRPDLLQAVNFGDHPERAFATLRKYQPRGPQMNAEFYPGWYDLWGKPHQRGKIERYLSSLEYMLKNDDSFSIYMAHGGTTWGLWSGANLPNFGAETTSYDYDAPISEAGWATEKFARTRELFSKYLLPGETIPDPPPKNPVITIPCFALSECAPLLENLPSPVEADVPGTMEQYDQGHGCIDYRTMLPAGRGAKLSVAEVHDAAWVFVDGKQIGVMDRRSNLVSVQLPAHKAPARLDILVEAMGRVNFGDQIADRKGLHGPVQLGGKTLTGWKIFKLPLDDAELSALHFQSGLAKTPAFWHGTFDLAVAGDTFLDLQSWGKGVVWVNGHCLGRFWDIGPTQTMYLPGPWMKAGRNDVVVLDLIGPREAKLAGLATPILDQLHPELSLAPR